MPRIALAIPAELHREMRRHPEFRWDEVARRALAREVDRLQVCVRLLAGARLTEGNAVALGRQINRAASRPRR